MKNRDYKKFALGNYYHVFNRGNGKQDIFKDEQDYLFFLKRIRENIVEEKVPFSKRREPSPGGYLRKLLPPGSFTLVSYCLMPNHFHLLIKQNTDLPVSKLLLKICTSYSKYFNQKYNRVGGLFQDSFKSVLIDTDAYLFWLSAYIHQNPKIAGLINNLETWVYSSYLDYVGLRAGNLCQKEIILNSFPSPEAYKKFIFESYDKIKSRKDIQNLLLE